MMKHALRRSLSGSLSIAALAFAMPALAQDETAEAAEEKDPSGERERP